MLCNLDSLAGLQPCDCSLAAFEALPVFAAFEALAVTAAGRASLAAAVDQLVKYLQRDGWKQNCVSLKRWVRLCDYATARLNSYRRRYENKSVLANNLTCIAMIL